MLHSVQPAAEHFLGVPGHLMGSVIIICGGTLFLLNLFTSLSVADERPA